MENIYRFSVTYKNEALGSFLAHTKWEAMQKAYFQYGHLREIKYFNAKKIS